ncbi:MAG TPA: efflux RND transporter periplasmic adaptor subunit, partial [Bryobacteraceae bacterium]|nr:efflux RND transporter periplasmic adaptor subunit [Bryobacteraceae bacterium]
MAVLLCLTLIVVSACSSGEAAGGRSGAGAEKGKGGRGAAVVPVVVANVERRQVPLEVRAIGNVEAWSSVAVRPRVGGPITKVHFEEGADVKAGQVLFTIDPRDYEQAVREAEAVVATQKATVGQGEANYRRDVAQVANARSQAQRYGELATKGIVSRQENEQLQTQATAAESALASSKAAIESARAAVQGAEAKLADARLQLSYATLRAPISGRTGSIAYKTGDLITPNIDPPMVVINQISPVYVTFSVAEQDLSQLRRYANRGKLVVAATPQDGTGTFEGVLDFLDNQIDAGTGTILLKARFANRERQLWPGQFVTAAVRLALPEETVVPVAALRNAQAGQYVFVVRPDMTAEQRKVESGRSQENLAVIAQGLKPGERVVVEGQLRLRPNSKVRIAER